MSTSKQRRDAAHRKLERQLQRREELAAQRHKQTILLAVIGTVVVLALVVWIVIANTQDTKKATTAAGECAYTPDPQDQGGPGVPTDTNAKKSGDLKLKVTTDLGDMEFTLDRSLAPCAVNSWDHLVSKNFFANTTCHRLTTSELKVLQCGDPTGTGAGGPGYYYDEEKPTGDDPYPKGSLAMANTGSAGSTGSQFFICDDSCSGALAKDYTLVGTVTSGLDVVQKVADAGSDNSNGQNDGRPKLPITITSIAKE